MNQRARDGDTVTNNGNPLPFVVNLAAPGTIVGYAANLDAFWLPSNIGTDRRGRAGVITSYQVTYGAPGVGASGNDVLRLQLIDQTADIAGAGTVSNTAAVVTGVGTAFTSFYKVGQIFRSGVVALKIITITDDTHLTLEATPPGSALSGAGYFLTPTLSSLATLTLPANTRQVAPVDLRVQMGGIKKGITLLPGQGVRLDSAGISTGGTQPSGISVRLFMGIFGLDG